MNKPHDVGGFLEFGPIDTSDDDRPSRHEWEARAFMIHRILLHKRVYTLNEFRYEIECMPPAGYASASYYERWFVAIESLLAQKGIALDGI